MYLLPFQGFPGIIIELRHANLYDFHVLLRVSRFDARRPDSGWRYFRIGNHPAPGSSIHNDARARRLAENGLRLVLAPERPRGEGCLAGV